jgi:hypothetical protein
VLCGTLDGLPRAFAQLDARVREQALLATKLAAVDNDSKNKPEDNAGEAPPEAASSELTLTATASMPREDRAVIRTDAMRRKVLAAACYP